MGVEYLVLAVDPGSRRTGLCVRLGNSCRAWDVVRRADSSLPAYTDRVLNYATELEETTDPADIYAVEHYHTPTGQLGRIDPAQIAETAWLTGALYQALRDITRDRFVSCVLVTPNRHGRAPLGVYPPQLVSSGERRGNWRTRTAGSSSDVSHARSAFDVAGAAVAQLRLDHAEEI